MFYFYTFLGARNRFVASFDNGVNSMKALYLLGISLFIKSDVFILTDILNHLFNVNVNQDIVKNKYNRNRNHVLETKIENN